MRVWWAFLISTTLAVTSLDSAAAAGIHDAESGNFRAQEEIQTEEQDGEQTEAYKSTQEYYMQLQTDAMYIDCPQPYQRHSHWTTG